MSNPMKDFVDQYEAMANANPNKLDTPVLCIRKADVDPRWMRAAWGPNWKAVVNERPCALCGEVVFVRDTFKDNKVLICQPCGPGFIEAMRQGPRA